MRVEIPITDHLASIPFLGGIPGQPSVFTGALVLAVMLLPTLAAVSRDVIRAVPRGLRESTFALGATWWETTWKVVLPAARAGLFGATVLALGRALAETVAVAMVIGNRPEIPTSIFSPGHPLAAAIANAPPQSPPPLYPRTPLAL